ncbi:MAG: SET domain-containing protein [Planctomycetota bacterium]|jgi:hypothetical protein
MDREHQKAQEMDLRIGDTNVGRGVFVTRDFAADEEILQFRGEVIDFATSLAKGERECDAFQIGPDVYLDLESPGVLINHSCEPNTGIRDDVRLVALRDLQAGEEIRYDYSTTMDEDHWELECRCGARQCRGLIRDFKWLPKDRRLQLLRRNIVPRFIIASELEAGRLTAEEIEGDPTVIRGGA